MPLLRPCHRLAAALVLLGATGAAFAGPAGTISSEGPVRCELDVSRRGGSVELTALAHAEKATRGEYAFHVSGRGTDIRQGGSFTIASGGTEQLGTVTLSGGGSGYDADLTLVVSGKTISCSGRVGGGF
ncbi:curli-like amyloid fiber formation chaperone CsgH [Aurantimonas sp. HBX-1]|uniref:curli-like amyloid fiber formation chaperone CsgH n=1 Tax=Aurantimonas sp. HBX-1 TaxID=2906072 RepID=UPI001F476F11|nr:curli-like amyloid fiber formation chaperone CsgH [Aurantimonas sp. HBX-1]UIJ73432.1 hypothetical protein LXB15_07290 [Aurantimonas sp. HBX-1]